MLYCQSSEKMHQVKDNSVELTVTSPPYWNAIDYDVHAKEGYNENFRNRKEDDTFDNYLSNISTIFEEVYRVTVPGGFCAVIIGTLLNKGEHTPLPMLLVQKMLDKKWKFHQDIIWNKVTGGVRRAGSFIQRPRSGYFYPNIMTEYVLIFRKEGPVRRGKVQALEINDLFKRDIANTVWHIAPCPPRSIDHPCPFPEELARRLVLLYSDEGETVLDPFIGSGQTAIAALRNKRKCVGYDTRPEYIKLTKERLENMPEERKHQLVPKMEKQEVQK